MQFEVSKIVPEKHFYIIDIDVSVVPFEITEKNAVVVTAKNPT